jgi:subtilisin-like proprotein convertase family protein
MAGIAIAALGVGAGAAGAATFSNTTPITIPAVGTASVYPSQITVSGQTAPITDVNVKLNGFQHAYPADVGVVLVGPGGQALNVMDCVGGSTPVAGLALTLDDSAAAFLPFNLAMVGGTFKPTQNCALLDTFSPPGPGSAYGNPGPGALGTATLGSTFNGASANGAWKLFVQDFGDPDGGLLAGGWSLEILPDKKRCKKGKKLKKGKCVKKKRKKKK